MNMNMLNTLKQSLNNSVWSMSPNDFLTFKHSIEQIKGDVGTYTMDGTNNDCDDDDNITPDANGKVIVSVNGSLVRGTGLDEDTCEWVGITELDNLDNTLIQLKNDDTVKTIVLVFNTPGGTCHSHATALLIQDIVQTKQVIGFIPSMCCSAGYEIASQCQELYCSETAWVGFIGTIFTRCDYTNANKQDGIAYTFITSSPKKLYLNPDTSMTDEEKQWIEESVMYSYNTFKDMVLSNRNIDEANLDSSIFIGKQAVKSNFCDGIKNNLQEI